MLKNFSPKSLGINGRQSELIELALTYGFASMDIDMYEMLRRTQRTTADDAAKFLKAAMGEGMGRLEQLGGFELETDLDCDDEAFTSQVGALHPLTELAAETIEQMTLPTVAIRRRLRRPFIAASAITTLQKWAK